MKTGDRTLFSEIVKQAEARNNRMHKKQQKETVLAAPPPPPPPVLSTEVTKEEEALHPPDDVEEETSDPDKAFQEVGPELPPNPQSVVDQLYMLAVFAESYRTQRRCSLIHSQVYFQHLRQYTDFYRQILHIVRKREKEEFEANQSSMFSYLGYSEHYQQTYQKSVEKLDSLESELDENASLRRDWSDMGPDFNAKYPDLRFTPVLFPMYGSGFTPKVRFGKRFVQLKSVVGSSHKDDGSGAGEKSATQTD